MLAEAYFFPPWEQWIVNHDAEIRELREVVANLQWTLVETLRCCELLGQDAAVDQTVLKRLEKARHAVKSLKPSPSLEWQP